MKTKVLLLFLFLIGCSEKSIQPKTYEITDEVTGKTYLLRKIPKLKKSVVYCHKHKENVVVWVDWHIHQTPEYTYRFDTFENYLEKTWVERHYGYEIKNEKND